MGICIEIANNADTFLNRDGDGDGDGDGYGDGDGDGYGYGYGDVAGDGGT
jgi:hypothetical protein